MDSRAGSAISPRKYELQFKEGPLGLTLQPFYDEKDHKGTKFPQVVVIRCIPSFQAEAFGAITPGDLMIGINDREVESFLEYAELIKCLRESPRPITIQFSSLSMTSPAEKVREGLQARIDALEHALSRPEIQLDEIREFSRFGLPDKYRGLVWQLLLGCIPPDRSKWEGHIKKQRELYVQYCQEMWKEKKPSSKLEGQAWYEQNDDNDEVKSKKSVIKKSERKKEEDEEDKEYEQVEDILDEDVWKDVQRTHPGYHFFTQPTYVKMHRILYIYGRLNSGVSYVQGMNEILAPIMYALGAYPGADEENYEADSFFCFAALMSDVRDLFIRSLDGEKTGLHGQLKSFGDLVARHDPQVAKHLLDLGIHTQFFAVRPLTTLLTREFELPDALRLWDSMLGSKKRFHFICCCCVALITTQHDFLLENDFPTCLKALQATCTIPVENIVAEADRICELEKRKQRGFEKNVEILAKDLFRLAARAARTVVEEAKLVVDELKEQGQKSTN